MLLFFLIFKCFTWIYVTVPTLDRQAADVQGKAVLISKALCKAVAAHESVISALLKPGQENVDVAHVTPPQLLAPMAALKHISPSHLPVQLYKSPESFCLY